MNRADRSTRVGFSLYMDSCLSGPLLPCKRGEIPDVDAPLDAGTEINLHVHRH